MIRLSQVRAELDEMQKPLEQLAARALKVRPEQIASVRLARKSVDARDKGDVHFSLTLDVETAKPLSRLPRGAEEIAPNKPLPAPGSRRPAHPPLVVGMGPAGLFAALRLAQAGLAARGRRARQARGRARPGRGDLLGRRRARRRRATSSSARAARARSPTASSIRASRIARCRHVLETLAIAWARRRRFSSWPSPTWAPIICVSVVRTSAPGDPCAGRRQCCFETKLAGLEIEDGRVRGRGAGERRGAGARCSRTT